MIKRNLKAPVGAFLWSNSCALSYILLQHSHLVD